LYLTVREPGQKNKCGRVSPNFKDTFVDLDLSRPSLPSLPTSQEK
jgi:hypothetical protein